MGFDMPDIDVINDLINEFYNPHNIFINNAGYKYVNNSDLLDIDGVTYAEEQYISSQAPSSIYNEDVDINFYISRYIVQENWNGFAQDIPSTTLFVRYDKVLTETAAHELGHCLNLQHTFYGTAPNSDEGCKEEIDADSENCCNCGDYVCDTPADDGFQNANGYSPDLTNIMSYYRPRDHFTEGQADRMKYSLLYDSELSELSTLPPQASNIDMNTTGSFTLYDTKWTRIDAKIVNANTEDYHWDWIVPNCYVRYSKYSSHHYIDVQPIPHLSSGGTSNYSITIQNRATDGCGNQSGWKSKQFDVVYSPAITPCPTLPCNVISTN